jgi:predicted NUDIX family NTP pyrophosphohydrolase
MMTSPRKSAGLLVFRGNTPDIEVLLAHPGGPYWSKKDAGAWTIPKGEFLDDEEPLAAARREFEEEMGSPIDGEFLELDPLRQPTGKVVYAWAVRGDFDPARLSSNLFSMEWPPKSGRRQEFPEVDRAAWFSIAEARVRILSGQAPFLEALLARISA